jgi:hypothetical protein
MHGHFGYFAVQIAVLEEQKNEDAENEAAENDDAKPIDIDPSATESTPKRVASYLAICTILETKKIKVLHFECLED